MSAITNDLNLTIDTYTYTGYAPCDCLFFDIETTGFSPRTTQVYLIGCVYFKDDKWQSRQWFAADLESETEILIDFFNFMNNYKVLIHFNGDGFDIPYLKERLEIKKIECNISNPESIDLFKTVSQCKKYLKLENYKQKTVETFFDIVREDKYSGGELINVFFNYQKNHDSESFELLILHNLDDIKGMTALLPVISYKKLIDGVFSFESVTRNENELIFNCQLHNELKKRVSLGYNDFYITAYKNTLKIRVKIYSGELKYFYRNYKDYYYLPAEDMAMHKSVAFYVDKDFRTRAKAANCYSRKSGIFIPQLSEIMPTYFKADYNDKTMYIELSDEFFNNNELIYKYLLDIIKAV